MSKDARLLMLLAGLIGAATLRAAEADSSAHVAYPDQGWGDETRQLFYFTPQGSRMIPYAWFMALESADGQGMFATTANLERYGFLAADAPHQINPHSLPIGFAIDPVEIPGRGRSLGLTCAACHTANVTVEGKVLRIDGAPAQLDFDQFTSDVAAAVRRTLFDRAAFQRFASRVLKAPEPNAFNQLRQQFTDFQATLAGDAAIRHPALISGFGRVDALTQIFNSVSVVDEVEPRNLRLVNAPVRYPPLWLTPELEYVQWAPVAASPISRNGGEALGVFGSATLTGPKAGWYDSSLLIRNLQKLETWVADLKPPHWDEATFGPIDRKLSATGEALYRQHCVSCHTAPPYRRTDAAKNYYGKTFIDIGRVDYRDIGTDPTYTDALAQRWVYTNYATEPAREGQTVVSAPAFYPRTKFPDPAVEGQPFDHVSFFFLRTVGEVVTRAMDKLGLPDAERTALNGFRLLSPTSPGGMPEPYMPKSLTDLKAGPLAGIWASGPYLHNGSVPTIDELLSPVSQRRSIFWTGARELDRKRLGYISDDAPGRFRFDTSLPGNHNTGHVYPPVGLSPAERAAIIEFLKTL
jgi:mono/diheme cytochrome c family protein